MRDDAKLRKETPQPDLRSAPLLPSSLRGGGYGKGDLHDTPGNTWLHGGDPSTKPGYHKGRAGQQKQKRKWRY